MKANELRDSLRVDPGPEPVDASAIPYIECLIGAGPKGFAPVGWLYRCVMDGLVQKGFARGCGTYYVTAEGYAEVAKRDRNRAREAR